MKKIISLLTSFVMTLTMLPTVITPDIANAAAGDVQIVFDEVTVNPTAEDYTRGYAEESVPVYISDAGGIDGLLVSFDVPAGLEVSSVTKGNIPTEQGGFGYGEREDEGYRIFLAPSSSTIADDSIVAYINVKADVQQGAGTKVYPITALSSAASEDVNEAVIGNTALGMEITNGSVTVNNKPAMGLSPVEIDFDNAFVYPTAGDYAKGFAKVAMPVIYNGDVSADGILVTVGNLPTEVTFDGITKGEVDVEQGGFSYGERDGNYRIFVAPSGTISSGTVIAYINFEVPVGMSLGRKTYEISPASFTDVEDVNEATSGNVNYSMTLLSGIITVENETAGNVVIDYDDVNITPTAAEYAQGFAEVAVPVIYNGEVAIDGLLLTVKYLPAGVNFVSITKGAVDVEQGGFAYGEATRGYKIFIAPTGVIPSGTTIAYVNVTVPVEQNTGVKTYHVDPETEVSTDDVNEATIGNAYAPMVLSSSTITVNNADLGTVTIDFDDVDVTPTATEYAQGYAEVAVPIIIGGDVAVDGLLVSLGALPSGVEFVSFTRGTVNIEAGGFGYSERDGVPRMFMAPTALIPSDTVIAYVNVKVPVEQNTGRQTYDVIPASETDSEDVNEATNGNAYSPMTLTPGTITVHNADLGTVLIDFDDVTVLPTAVEYEQGFAEVAVPIVYNGDVPVDGLLVTVGTLPEGVTFVDADSAIATEQGGFGYGERAGIGYRIFFAPTGTIEPDSVIGYINVTVPVQRNSGTKTYDVNPASESGSEDINEATVGAALSPMTLTPGTITVVNADLGTVTIDFDDVYITLTEEDVETGYVDASMPIMVVGDIADIDGLLISLGALPAGVELIDITATVATDLGGFSFDETTGRIFFAPTGPIAADTVIGYINVRVAVTADDAEYPVDPLAFTDVEDVNEATKDNGFSPMSLTGGVIYIEGVDIVTTTTAPGSSTTTTTTTTEETSTTTVTFPTDTTTTTEETSTTTVSGPTTTTTEETSTTTISGPTTTTTEETSTTTVSGPTSTTTTVSGPTSTTTTVSSTTTTPEPTTTTTSVTILGTVYIKIGDADITPTDEDYENGYARVTIPVVINGDLGLDGLLITFDADEGVEVEAATPGDVTPLPGGFGFGDRTSEGYRLTLVPDTTAPIPNGSVVAYLDVKVALNGDGAVVYRIDPTVATELEDVNEATNGNDFYPMNLTGGLITVRDIGTTTTTSGTSTTTVSTTLPFLDEIDLVIGDRTVNPTADDYENGYARVQVPVTINGDTGATNVSVEIELADGVVFDEARPASNGQALVYANGVRLDTQSGVLTVRLAETTPMADGTIIAYVNVFVPVERGAGSVDYPVIAVNPVVRQGNNVYTVNSTDGVITVVNEDLPAGTVVIDIDDVIYNVPEGYTGDTAKVAVPVVISNDPGVDRILITIDTLPEGVVFDEDLMATGADVPIYALNPVLSVLPNGGGTLLVALADDAVLENGTVIAYINVIVDVTPGEGAVVYPISVVSGTAQEGVNEATSGDTSYPMLVSGGRIIVYNQEDTIITTTTTTTSTSATTTTTGENPFVNFALQGTTVIPSEEDYTAGYAKVTVPVIISDDVPVDSVTLVITLPDGVIFSENPVSGNGELVYSQQPALDGSTSTLTLVLASDTALEDGTAIAYLEVLVPVSKQGNGANLAYDVKISADGSSVLVNGESYPIIVKDGRIVVRNAAVTTTTSTTVSTTTTTSTSVSTTTSTTDAPEYPPVSVVIEKGQTVTPSDSDYATGYIDIPLSVRIYNDVDGIDSLQVGIDEDFEGYEVIGAVAGEDIITVGGGFVFTPSTDGNTLYVAIANDEPLADGTVIAVLTVRVDLSDTSLNGTVRLPVIFTQSDDDTALVGDTEYGINYTDGYVQIRYTTQTTTSTSTSDPGVNTPTTTTISDTETTTTTTTTTISDTETTTTTTISGTETTTTTDETTTEETTTSTEDTTTTTTTSTTTSTTTTEVTTTRDIPVGYIYHWGDIDLNGVVNTTDIIMAVKLLGNGGWVFTNTDGSTEDWSEEGTYNPPIYEDDGVTPIIGYPDINANVDQSDKFVWAIEGTETVSTADLQYIIFLAFLTPTQMGLNDTGDPYRDLEFDRDYTWCQAEMPIRSTDYMGEWNPDAGEYGWNPEDKDCWAYYNEQLGWGVDVDAIFLRHESGQY